MIVWLNDSLGLGAVAARSFSQCRDQDSPATLLHNAYFTRLWIVQEILLAPSTSLLLDGNVWMTWKAIREVVEHTPHDYGAHTITHSSGIQQGQLCSRPRGGG